MKYLIFLIILFPSPLYAQDSSSSLPETLEVEEESAEVTTVDEKQTVAAYKCTHKSNDLFREVKIIHQDQGCEVTYTKAVGTVNEKTKSLWRAKNSTEYCDNKGQAFVEEKLQQEYGWVCTDTITK